jgi:hypothetical protein
VTLEIGLVCTEGGNLAILIFVLIQEDLQSHHLGSDPQGHEIVLVALLFCQKNNILFMQHAYILVQSGDTEFR